MLPNSLLQGQVLFLEILLDEFELRFSAQKTSLN